MLPPLLGRSCSSGRFGLPHPVFVFRNPYVVVPAVGLKVHRGIDCAWSQEACSSFCQLLFGQLDLGELRELNDEVLA